MQTLNATVNRIVFASPNSSYKILIFDVEGEYFDLTAKGNMDVSENQNYIFHGEFKEDPRYGEYFEVTHYEIPQISEEDEVVEYLSSNIFEGIGRRTARKIYKAFLDDTLNVIEETPERLLEIGISERLVENIASVLQSNNLHPKLYAFLKEFNVNDYVINNLFDYIKNENFNGAMRVLRRNPYYFVEHVYGYTFNIADQIYMKYENDPTSNVRVSYYILNIINNICFETGDTVVEIKKIINNVCNNLHIEKDDVQNCIEDMHENGEVYVFSEFIMHKNFHEQEHNLANLIRAKNSLNVTEFSEKKILTEIAKLENELNINYSGVQKNAIYNALNAPISIITGGPGTGKTTIIKAVASIYRKLHFEDKSIIDASAKILLCAPTGRASQRMKEATGFFAKTIHSALHYDPHSMKFKKDENENLMHELIIVDEFSMVDVFLANALFKAIRPDAHVIIVGDPAQLESVLPGSVLRDILNSKYIKSIKLDYVYRQGEGSSIVSLAHQMNNNEKLELVKTDDMSVIKRDGVIVDIIKQVVDRSMQAGYTLEEVQVLYPKYKGLNGIDNLNKVLKPEVVDDNILKANETIYQVGDKVMQLKNNYDLEIYNGDIGFITQIFQNDGVKSQVAMEVDFGRLKVKLSIADVINITHAYAISIHKSQGSEFKVIIIPVTKESQNMLTKKLIYTAITRAKDKLILVGDVSYLESGLIQEEYHRITLLEKLLS